MDVRDAPRHPWDDVLSESDRQVFEAARFGGSMGFGSQPALLVVDVVYGFVGEEPEPVLDSIRRWRTSCGVNAWDALPAIRGLLEASRSADVPVVFTTTYDREGHDPPPGRWADKRSGSGGRRPGRFSEIVEEVAPRDGELVLRKDKPSAFFGTPLASYLVDRGVDSVIICGGTTSGCVRATAVDAFSYNYRVAVIDSATFDRADISHKVALLDIHQKYGDVVSVQDTKAHLQQLTGNR